MIWIDDDVARLRRRKHTGKKVQLTTLHSPALLLGAAATAESSLSRKNWKTTEQEQKRVNLLLAESRSHYQSKNRLSELRTLKKSNFFFFFFSLSPVLSRL